MFSLFLYESFHFFLQLKVYFFIVFQNASLSAPEGASGQNIYRSGREVMGGWIDHYARNNDNANKLNQTLSLFSVFQVCWYSKINKKTVINPSSWLTRLCNIITLFVSRLCWVITWVRMDFELFFQQFFCLLIKGNQFVFSIVLSSL